MSRPQALLSIATLGVLLALACVATAATSTSSSATARSGGLTVTLTATPARVTRGSTVRLRLTALERSARGAFGDRLSYGDGTASPPTAVPQFCIAGTPPPASRTWRFSHRYHAAGTYHLTATVFVNCTSDHATTLVTVRVK
ncbi:MAG TPA: hypothetical protein VHY18_12265 [Solirubrobacteraceae bacterium]|nr:hypothetical protein [Solirubrobacteraceae bacterium]